MKVLSEIADCTAHGKIILIGEHSVVHNEPAIAIPFTSANAEVTIQKVDGESTIDSIYHNGKIKDAPHTIHNLIEPLTAVCAYFDRSTEGLHITVKSDIPAERGMGSSAAVATALVRALFNLFDGKLTDELLNQFVSVSEKIAHGNPSGLDAKVVRSEQSVYFIRDQETEFFTVNLPGYLVIADTGDEGETGAAVRAVGELIKNPLSQGRIWVQELGKMTKKARHFIEKKDLKSLGEILDRAQHNLRQLKVSNTKLDTLVDVAKANGALGAKLTGGGRGGCMIVLVESEEQADEMSAKLQKAGATKTWIHPLGVSEYDN